MKLRMTIHPKMVQKALMALVALVLVGAAQGQVVKTEGSQDLQGDGVKHFRNGVNSEVL